MLDNYVGRFAPSPTGPLHAGSLVAAMASYLDARAHRGRWLLRIEDIDPPREVPGAAESIVATLAAHGFVCDGPVCHQSRRIAHYSSALGHLQRTRVAYRCQCSRRDIEIARQACGLPDPPPGAEIIYPRTCRDHPPPAQARCAWRLDVDAAVIEWQDRSDSMPRRERLDETVGDFVLQRRDGLWSYQLAVVVDDGSMSVTDVVRGDDLMSNTARQCLLQQMLNLPRPRYLHVPVVRNANGEKLSKQTGAPAIGADIDPPHAVRHLNDALAHLGLERIDAQDTASFWPRAILQWHNRRCA